MINQSIHFGNFTSSCCLRKHDVTAMLVNDSRNLKCDASSVFAVTELKDADGVGCLSLVQAVSLPGDVVDDGFGGIWRQSPHGVLCVDSVVLVLQAQSKK